MQFKKNRNIERNHGWHISNNPGGKLWKNPGMRNGMLLSACARVSGFNMNINCTVHNFCAECHSCLDEFLKESRKYPDIYS